MMARAWAMPSPDTLSIPPIADFARRWLQGRAVIVDPFARNSHWATLYSNDINPKTSARFHMEARAFLAMLVERGVCAEAVIFDPPFSPTQIKRAYEDAGLSVSRDDTQSARVKAECRDLIRKITGPGSVVLSFGWNTCGMGKDWRTNEVLLVDHGGDHNATLCMAQTLPRITA